MPWPRPRRTLCVLCLASCEYVVSSFGVGTSTGVIATPGRLVRGGATSSDLSMTGLQDGSGSRKGLPLVQAVVTEPATAPPITVPPGVEEEKESAIEDENNLGPVPPLPSGVPPRLPSIRNGVKMELGKYKAEPFEEGTFPPNYLYALQRLRSEEDDSFGAAFISLRAANDRVPTRTWNVGKPNATHLMVLARFKLWWMMPKHTTKASEVPPETQMMLTKLSPDPETGRELYGLFIPLIDGRVKCSLKGLPDQSLQLFAETGCPKTPVPSSDVAGLYVGVHEDPFKLVEKSFKLVNSRLRNQVKAGSFGAGGLVPGLVHDAEKQLSRWKKSEVISKSVDKSSPDFSNYLGWCTWDSFYTSVDHNKVLEGLHSLKDAGIRPKWLVLDDGWQSTSNAEAANGEQWMDHLTSLWANSKFKDSKAGTDLGRTVRKARADFGIDYFLVWHAIGGYWAGVDLESPDLAKYKPRRASLNPPPGVVEVDPDMKMFFRMTKFLNKRFGVVPPDKIRSFYDDYHRYLKSQGVDGVKVDAQSVVNFLGPKNGGSVMLARVYHSALSKSVRRYFPDSEGAHKGEGGRIIHCMCHDSEILLQLPACYGRQPVIRGSDDFYPRDKGSHSPHIYANAFNGLMISSCGLQDWDMFQTGIGEASWMHAVARAVSGGPVYISDRPGEHNTEILRRMVLEDGGVLKPPSNALPCLKCLFVDPQRDPEALLSIWNECEVHGHGVMAVFNLFGTAWNQGRRTYAPVRVPNGARSVNGDKPRNGNSKSSGEGAINGDMGAIGELGSELGITGEVKPSDCHHLLLEELELREDTEEELGNTGAGEPSSARYAMHFHFTNRLAVGGLHEGHLVHLDRGKSEVVAISRVQSLETAAGQVEFASIGLADMFNAGGAIVSEQILPSGSSSGDGSGGDTPRIELMVKGNGRFVAFCSLRPSVLTFEGNHITFTYKQTREGVPFIEVILPDGFTGRPRRLAVKWGPQGGVQGVINGAEGVLRDGSTTR